ncbi:MAG: hypothetical protein JXA73_22740 [Acidobacteria bacterium]|nr:hypothetical protein [Acidobacteriota bacterium]
MQHLSVAVFVCLALCVSAFPQETGTIVCDPGSTLPVPAWTSPGGAHVVEQLSCGQMVSIFGLEKGYFRIQIGERFAYVYAKYVRVTQPQKQRIIAAEEQAKEGQEPPPAVTAAADPAKPPKPYVEKQRRHEGGLYFDVSHMYYGEKDFMRNKGYFWGVSGDYTYHPDKFMLKVDGRFSIGSVDYWSRGTGTDDGLRDYNFETRFAFGYDLGTSEKASFIPFIGLGYRYLFDGEEGSISTSGARDYDRKANYLYSPIGMETMFRLGSGWSLGATGEYDLLWHGWQYSEIGDYVIPLEFPVFLPNFVAKNDQEDGWGARGSIKVVKNFGELAFVIEPYYRFWELEDSDLFEILQYPYYGIPGYDYSWLKEPKNSTTEWGINFGIKF